LLVPGLLQTAEYARALFKAWQTTEDDDEVDQLVTARLDRQRIFDQTRPPSLWAVIDEGVLRRRIGGPKVMHDQLVHLTRVSAPVNRPHSVEQGWLRTCTITRIRPDTGVIVRA
jgi:hypothetical protein